MKTKFLQHLGISVAVSLLVCLPAVAQELPSKFPGVTTLGERTIPAPVGISPEMLEVVKARQISPVIPAPTTTEDWLKLQTLFDVAGEELGRSAAVFAGTPATDLENISDTWNTLEGLDPLGSRDGMLAAAFDLYIGEADSSNPLLSPVNGNLDGFSPTILISGTRDLLLSDTVRMHRALRKVGVKSDLHVYDGQTHGDYMQNLVRYVPESEDALKELYAFFDEHLE